MELPSHCGPPDIMVPHSFCLAQVRVRVKVKQSAVGSLENNHVRVAKVSNCNMTKVITSSFYANDARE